MGGRHATGPVSAHRRVGVFRAAIYERDWRPSCIVRRSSSSSVVSGARTHCDARDNRHLVAIKTNCVCSFGEILTNSEGHYSTPAKPPNFTQSQKAWLAKWRPANMACHSSTTPPPFFVRRRARRRRLRLQLYLKTLARQSLSPFSRAKKGNISIVRLPVVVRDSSGSDRFAPLDRLASSRSVGAFS